MSIWVKICKYVDLGKRNIQKCHFLSKFSKISILDKRTGNSRFWSKVTKMLIWTKLQKMIIVKIFEKMSTWVKICKYLDFGQNFLKISIFIIIFENIACRENCWKIWNLVEMFENSWFWSKCTKMSILVIIEENIDFSRNLQNDWFW